MTDVYPEQVRQQLAGARARSARLLAAWQSARRRAAEYSAAVDHVVAAAERGVEDLGRIAHDQLTRAEAELAALRQRYEDEHATAVERAHETDRVRTRLTAAQAELAALHVGEEPDEDERLFPTPGQWIWRWNRATPEERLIRAQWMIDNWQTAHTCKVLAFHEQRIAELRAELAQALDGSFLHHKNAELHERAKQAEARIAAVRALVAEWRSVSSEFDPALDRADQIEAALDGPADQSADDLEPPSTEPGRNAEDCPACDGTNPPYPFICPGHPDGGAQ